MLSIILRNLIANTIKFTNSGGRIDVCAITRQDHIEISITVNGVGINNENQKKLFGVNMGVRDRYSTIYSISSSMVLWLEARTNNKPLFSFETTL